MKLFVNCNYLPPLHSNPTPCVSHLLEILSCLLVRLAISYKLFIIYVGLIASIGDESYLHMFKLNQVESLRHCWEEGYRWEGPKTQPHSGQIELLTDLLENYLTSRKNATPDRLLNSQRRWKELSTEVAVISQFKRQRRQSQLVRGAFVSHIVMRICHVISDHF